jgi:hypothetical protein
MFGAATKLSIVLIFSPWLSMAQFHQKPVDGIFAILRFGAADQLVV